MKSLICILLIFGFATARGDETSRQENSPTDLNRQITQSMSQIQEDNKQQRTLAGGTFFASAGAFAVAATFGSFVGNDATTPTMPWIYLGATTLLTAGGIYVFAKNTNAENEILNYQQIPDMKLEDIKWRDQEGLRILKAEAHRAKLERMWGGAAVAGMGLINIALGEMTSGESGQGQTSLAVGYAASALGFADLIIEERVWSSISLIALGFGNVITNKANPANPPSSDYLLTSGALTVASGAVQFFISRKAEKEDTNFKTSLMPIPHGIYAQVCYSFN